MYSQYSILRLILKCVLIILVIKAAFGFIDGLFDISDYSILGFILEIVDAVIIIAIIKEVYFNIYRENLFDKFNDKLGTVKNVLITILIVSICLGLAYITSPITNKIPRPKIFDEISVEILQKPSTTIEIVIAFLSIVIIGPLFEEIFFRGFIYKTLRTKYGIALSIFISFIIFYLFHLDPRMIFMLLVASITLCLSYEYTQSLGLSFLIHSGYNFGSVLLSWYGAS